MPPGHPRPRAAEDANDELLKNMVYDNLAYANYNCFNHLLILEYSQVVMSESPSA